MHLSGYRKLHPHRGLGHLNHRFFHILPARIAELVAQLPLRLCPVRLRRRQLPVACGGQAEKTFPPVLSAFGANPALLPQQPQCSRQSRTIHGKAGAQPLLISLSHLGQCGEQTVLRDLEACLSQFLVVNPGDDPAESAKILTGAGQLKE